MSRFLESGGLYKIRDCVSLFVRARRKSSTLLCLFDSSRVTISFAVNSSTLDCVRCLDGHHSISEIASACGVPKADVQSLVLNLVEENIVEPANIKQPTENSKFRRQLNFFSSFETKRTKRTDFQERLETARVVVLGLGGIGTWLVDSVARAGVQHFVLIDPDRIDPTNLHRQSLYFEPDVRRFKVKVAAERISSINKAARVNTVRKTIETSRDLRPHVKDASLVINCSDFPDVSVTNQIVSDVCVPARIPHLLCGGYDGHLSFVGQTVIPYQTSCWECYEKGETFDKSLRGFEPLIVTDATKEGGTIAPIAAITANIHALEAIKVLTEFSAPMMTNFRAEIDFETLALTRHRIPRRRKCRLCGSSS